jgi:hypothetical protein
MEEAPVVMPVTVVGLGRRRERKVVGNDEGPALASRPTRLMSLTYEDPKSSPRGKTSEDTDTVQGRFVALVPYEKIVWVVEFESQDPRFAGEMRISFGLADVEGGTEVVVLCEEIPKGVRPEDNERGCRSSLENLAALLE